MGGAGLTDGKLMPVNVPNLHGYFKVYLNEVWKTVTDDLPVLDRALQQYTNRIRLPVQREKNTDLER